MPRNIRRNPSPLSSNDPTNRVIAVRLPADLLSAVDAACAEHDVTPSEFLRGLVSEWAYGKTQLSGPDEGYTQARSMAAQLAHVIVRETLQNAMQQAIENLPASHEAARSMLQGYNAKRSERR